MIIIKLWNGFDLNYKGNIYLHGDETFTYIEAGYVVLQEEDFFGPDGPVFDKIYNKDIKSIKGVD